jgi:hypothetical protein
MDIINKKYSIVEAVIVVLVTAVATHLIGMFFAKKSSLEIISRPEEVVIDRKEDIEGFKIYHDGIELNKLVKYTFTLWNNGDTEFPEGTFSQQPVIIKFFSPIRGKQIDNKSPSRLEWDLNWDKHNNQVSIRPLGILNAKSWMTFSVYVDDVPQTPPPYTIEDINISGITKIDVRHYDQTQEIIRKRTNDAFANFANIFFLFTIVASVFLWRAGKHKYIALKILESVNLDEANKSELKKKIDKLYQLMANIVLALLAAFILTTGISALVDAFGHL